jgi:hypothetical protein
MHDMIIAMYYKSQLSVLILNIDEPEKEMRLNK